MAACLAAAAPRTLFHPRYGQCTITALAYGVAMLTHYRVVPTVEDMDALWPDVAAGDPPGVSNRLLIARLAAAPWCGLRIAVKSLPHAKWGAFEIWRAGGAIVTYRTPEEAHAVWAYDGGPAGLETMDGDDPRIMEWLFFRAHADAVMTLGIA